MASSHQNNQTLLIPLPKTPRTYKDVKLLGLRELKTLCKDANISTEGVGREALEILLCLEVGISTSDLHLSNAKPSRIKQEV